MTGLVFKCKAEEFRRSSAWISSKERLMKMGNYITATKEEKEAASWVWNREGGDTRKKFTKLNDFGRIRLDRFRVRKPMGKKYLLIRC